MRLLPLLPLLGLLLPRGGSGQQPPTAREDCSDGSFTAAECAAYIAPCQANGMPIAPGYIPGTIPFAQTSHCHPPTQIAAALPYT